MCGDDFEMKTYHRFGELRVQDKSLASSSTSKVCFFAKCCDYVDFACVYDVVILPNSFVFLHTCRAVTRKSSQEIVWLLFLDKTSLP